MVVVPTVTPLTIPVSEPTVALVVLLLHDPPGTASVSNTVAPVQTVNGPKTGPGVVLTVSVVIVLQPVGNV
jgi:hypothetical protein